MYFGEICSGSQKPCVEWRFLSSKTQFISINIGRNVVFLSFIWIKRWEGSFSRKKNDFEAG